MSTPISEAPTPAPAGAIAVPDTPYVPLPGDEKADIPANELVDERKAEIIEPALTQGDKEAIDTSNIIGERTRHARPLSGTYQMPGDEEGLPVEFVEVNSSGLVTADEDGDVDGDVDLVENGEEDKTVPGEGIVEGVRGVAKEGVEGGVGDGEGEVVMKVDEVGNVDADMNGEVGVGEDDGEMDVGVVTIK
ncbi:hypothetical protein F4805DRAFT_460520 [Annulohypoxylon moriforme]|nr:hypothetical protein F4805DRAFT_460520 [Annulohypoxylon moriforme]